MAKKSRATAPLTKAERGVQTRARLVEATIQAIAEDGIAGASVERITERAGVSRGLVRHYYGSKSRLLAEAFQLLADDYRDMLGMGADAPTASDESAVLRLRAAVLPMFERLRGNRIHQHAWFGFWALARSDADIEQINHSLYADIVDHLGELVAAAAAEQGRDVDAKETARGLAAMLEGAWVHCLIGVEGTTIAAAERLCLDYAARLLGLESLDGAAAASAGAAGER